MAAAGASTKRFKYVYIPADVHEPVQERELAIPEGKDVECLLDELKAHFGSTVSAAASAAQRKALLAQLGDKAASVDERMLEMASNMQMVENISLLANHRDAGYVGVNMYCDDMAVAKDLPPNPRASGIAECCGKLIQVRGDAFLARVFDNEDDFERRDFTLSEVDSGAAWVKAAKAQADKREKGGGENGLRDVLERAQALSANKPSAAPRIKELTPAEAAKDDGNAAAKKGDWAAAESAYRKALALQPDLGAAASNLVLALLKLGRHGEAEAEASKVLAGEPGNVKVLLRRGAAREALGHASGAAEDYAEALRREPGNKEAAAGLDRTRPAPPPAAPEAAAGAEGQGAATGAEGPGVGAGDAPMQVDGEA